MIALFLVLDPDPGSNLAHNFEHTARGAFYEHLLDLDYGVRKFESHQAAWKMCPYKACTTTRPPWKDLGTRLLTPNLRWRLGTRQY